MKVLKARGVNTHTAARMRRWLQEGWRAAAELLFVCAVADSAEYATKGSLVVRPL